MAGMSEPNETSRNEENWVRSTALFLHESKAADVKLLDLRGLSGIADYFVLATVTSYAQLKGLVNNLQDFFADQGIPCKSSGKHLQEDIWTLLDCEYFIVHLMSKEARDFYSLEKLWFEAADIDLNLPEL